MNKINPATVLLVDADADEARRSKNELEAQGYRVICAGSGEQAFAAFEREKIDAVVVAALLPDMHVLDLIDDIAAKRDRNVRIIVNDAGPNYRHDFRYWAADAIVDRSSYSQRLFNYVATQL
ncbi:MAG: response regulator [candidate division KSB1 bacterium]|nr:response regulator [candidate division KSB1 bacterium]